MLPIRTRLMRNIFLTLILYQLESCSSYDEVYADSFFGSMDESQTSYDLTQTVNFAMPGSPEIEISFQERRC
jgi:hypothetical protein